LADSPSNHNHDHPSLRRRLREQRRTLPDVQRRIAELQTAGRLGKLGAFKRATRIGVYFSVDGEFDLGEIIDDSLARNKMIYVPVLQRQGLRFARLRTDSHFRRNRFGIPEPVERTYIDPRFLDIVLTPLVAFDGRGTRIGMGAGYYDRCFRFLGSRSLWAKPKLIGVGFEFQQSRYVERRPWDIPLWAAVTEKNTYRFCAGTA